jgi:hypothetical protein
MIEPVNSCTSSVTLRSLLRIHLVQAVMLGALAHLYKWLAIRHTEHNDNSCTSSVDRIALPIE